MAPPAQVACSVDGCDYTTPVNAPTWEIWTCYRCMPPLYTQSLAMAVAMASITTMRFALNLSQSPA